MNSKQDQRERRVRALLETLNDPYELPRHEPAVAGPAPSKRVPCDVCNRTGKVVTAYTLPPYTVREQPCPSCGGRGMRRRRKGDQAFDEYLNLPVSEAESKLKAPPRQFRLDEDIRRLWFELQRLERVDEPDSDDLLKALQAKDWLDRRGSYRELRRALGVLERRSSCVHGAVYRRYLRNVAAVGSSRFEALVGIGVSFLAVEMRGEIRVPHAFERAEAHTRVKGVVELAAEGKTAGQIARLLGMPKRKVQRILTPPVSSDAAGTVDG